MRINVDGKPYPAHRLAYLYMTGEWPQSPHIDHADLNPFNNRWANIIEASVSQNAANRSAIVSHGLKWAYKQANGKWMSVITVGRKQRYVGTYETAHAAHEAGAKIAREAHGQFARTK